ncbi:MAG: malate dehydrogenase [Chloroflexota bacterium]|nr:malate dehydrogenase [Chloroflexota bacterium]
MRSKITIVGAGNVGASCAQLLAQRDYADIVLVDIIEGMPQGKALDLLESGPPVGYDSHVLGTNDYRETANSDIAVITSGVPRKAGMSRDDLVLTNMKIVRGVTQELIKHSPNCIIIVVANPLDAMAQLVLQTSHFSRNRVIGMSGILDTSRFRAFLAQELDVSVEDVFAYVLGGHGDMMVPLTRLATVGGVPISDVLSEETISRIVERTINGGGEIVALLKTGSAYYAPAAAIAQMVDSIVLDKKRILPCSVHLEGEYGINDLFVGVPVKLGRNGMEEIFEIKLTADEQAALHNSADTVRELIHIMQSYKDER